MKPLMITSTQNPHVKATAKLRDRKGRERQGRSLIDGQRELTRAMACDIELVELFVREPLIEPTQVSGDGALPIRELIEQAIQSGASIYMTAANVFERLAFGDRNEGVVGVATTPQPTLEALSACLDVSSEAGPPLLGVLERVEKPGNIGAVLRSADGAGLSGIILADGGTDLYNPNTVRASMGTIFSTSCATATTEETLAWLRDRGFQIFTARVEGSVPYADVDFRGPSAIVLGNEANGLTARWEGEGITPVRLPMRGLADSLNVSVAAAVVFYEALRQRSERGG